MKSKEESVSALPGNSIPCAKRTFWNSILKKTPAKLFVVDTKDYELEGVEEKFRWIYAPFIACSLLIDRLSIQMSLKLGHDMQLRRYYRQFEY